MALNYRHGFRPVHVGLDFGEFGSSTAAKASALSAQMQADNAYNYGKSAGIQAAEGKQARVPSYYYGSVLAEGTDMSNAQNRAAFDKGFYEGYDAAAAGLGTVGPGGQTATSVLKDITIAEAKKAADVFGARQTELDLNYRGFDKLINDEKSKYSSMAGGVGFLGEWRSLMNDWTSANGAQLADDMLTYYETQLEGARQKREGLIAADAAMKGIKQFTSVPESIITNKPGTTTPVAPKPGTAPVAGKIMGLSKPVAIGIGLLLLGGIGAGVYFATREEYELGPDGKPRIGPDGKPIPKRKPPQINGVQRLPPTRQALPMPPAVPMMAPPRRP